MPSCLRIATLLRALEKVSLITLSFFFFFFLSSFLGVLGDGDGDGGFFASKMSITWSFQRRQIKRWCFFQDLTNLGGTNDGGTSIRGTKRAAFSSYMGESIRKGVECNISE
jgi:hypothetical protein